MAGKKIADISHYQGEIDWYAARQELDMAIFRASVGSNPDKRYLDYTALCGIPYGAYHYVKAGTAEEAREEAQFFVKCANAAEKKPLFYIADIEYKAQTEQTTEEVCVAFLRELRALGCGKIGLYINTRYKWAGAAVTLCDIMWIPRWGKNDGNVPAERYEPPYPCDIWQYTSKGRIAGIKGDVDLDMLKGDKPLEWFTEGWNTEEKKQNEGGDTMFTNLQLAAYCEQVYAAAWVYWYGTCGYACSTSLYTRKKEQYPKQYTASRESGYKADIKAGKMCADCVGLIKSFFWKDGTLDGANKYQANNCPDRSADGMFSLCKERGPIASMPDIPGLVVHKSGHIGVYVGNGYTVEMKGFAYDCVKQKVTSGPWTEWGKLPDSMIVYVEGITSAEETIYELGDRELSKGCTGADVTAMQEALISLGYALPRFGADGDFGEETLAAVKKFQRDHDMEETGLCDATTFKTLLAAQTPTNETPAQEPDTPDGGSEPAYVLIIEGKRDMLKLVQSAYGGTLALVDSVEVMDA